VAERGSETVQGVRRRRDLRGPQRSSSTRRHESGRVDDLLVLVNEEEAEHSTRIMTGSELTKERAAAT
jgi:hypothetical protein